MYSEKNKHKSNLILNIYFTCFFFHADVAHTGGITQNFEKREHNASWMMSYLSFVIERKDKAER